MLVDDRGSVKSDQVHSNESMALIAAGGGIAGITNRVSLLKPAARNLPLLPKVRDDATMGRTHSLPDNVLMQDEKMRQQANLRMQTRLHFM